MHSPIDRRWEMICHGVRHVNSGPAPAAALRFRYRPAEVAVPPDTSNSSCKVGRPVDCEPMRVACSLIGLILLNASVALAQPSRPTVGVAFGGGSARGIAHIGVIKWFEEHHVPIDVAAGTSMGGLVGGAFATGMTADELRTLITTTDWDLMFGASSFP